jgi:hypothetical protein
MVSIYNVFSSIDSSMFSVTWPVISKQPTILEYPKTPCVFEKLIVSTEDQQLKTFKCKMFSPRVKNLG